ncbi:MAG: FliA/WhiG family RNA polymerase sigma factor [Planctomycetota bacterium]|jgi:RNA polymerase sigma factor for flagellar operon FliA
MKALQLEKNDIQQVWTEFFKTRSERCRNILMENYLHLVKYSAERICVKLPDKVELDDLIQAGIFGLKDALEAYDPERGVKFETYCAPRIRGSILDELRSMDWVPRLVRARAHQLGRAMQTLEAELGRIPTEQELAEELELDKVEFHRLQRDANAIGLISLNNSFNESEGEKDVREIDIIEDQKSKNPVTEAQKRDLKLIVILYYYEEMTMKEIGATLDLSESRVSQMHSSIVARLKAQMDTRKKEFVITT